MLPIRELAARVPVTGGVENPRSKINVDLLDGGMEFQPILPKPLKGDPVWEEVQNISMVLPLKPKGIKSKIKSRHVMVLRTAGI